MLWAVTTFYNPAKFRVRNENFAKFVSALKIPLLVVEHAPSGCFEARAGATIHVPVTGGDVLWQKERLLNVALEHLPSSCTRVAWMDCDLLIRDSGWSDRNRRMAGGSLSNMRDGPGKERSPCRAPSRAEERRRSPASRSR